jgi:hypothetical protein
LIVAYPNRDKDTEFSFTYWIAAYKEPVIEPWYEFEGAQGEDLFMILCGIAAVLLFCIICVCCYCCSKQIRRVKADASTELELGNKGTKGVDVHLEDEDEEFEAYATKRAPDEDEGLKNNN